MQVHGLFVHDTSPLQEGRQRTATQPAALARFVAPRRKAFPVRLLEDAIEHVREIAAVEFLAHRRLVRHLRGLDEIAPPQFRGIHFHFGGRLVHQPLEKINRFRPPGAAVGAHEVGVRHHCRAAQMQRRNVIYAGDHLRTHGDYDDGARTAGVGADVADDVDAQTEDLAVSIEGKLSVVDLVATVIAPEEFLAAARAPVHRALEFARGPGADDVFGIQLRLHAETAADIAHDDTHALHRYLQAGFRQGLLQSRRILATGAQGHASTAGIEFGNAAARFHAHRHEPLVVQR